MLDRAFAAVYDRALAGVERTGLAAERGRLLASARGRVLEVGAGTGVNLLHLPTELDAVTLVEPSPAMRRRAAERARLLGRSDVTVVDAPAEALPLADGSVDTAIVTLALCTVDDASRAAAELRRVLAPGGRLLVLEHVRGQGRTLRWQRAIAPAWRRVARGCHLTRDTAATLADAGFDVSDLSPWQLPGGGITGPAIVGVARPV